MILGVPVVDGHLFTKKLLETVAKTATDPQNLRVVIIDNASDQPYERDTFPDYPFVLDIVRCKENKGYYYPLIDLYKKYDDEAIGLIHNDMLLYTPGWDVMMRDAFTTDPLLGLIGLCGSSELDERGGRGGGTMCNFMGWDTSIGDQVYKGQSPAAGLNVTGLHPAIVLDSLFMMFRRAVIPQLVREPEEGWDDLTLAHFYDRIWPCRTIEAGYRVAVMGVDCDHIGGITATGNVRYRNDCIAWLDQRGIPYDNPETSMYLVAEQRFLSEYRENKHFMPAWIGGDYAIRHS